MPFLFVSPNVSFTFLKPQKQKKGKHPLHIFTLLFLCLCLFQRKQKKHLLKVMNWEQAVLNGRTKLSQERDQVCSQFVKSIYTQIDQGTKFQFFDDVDIIKCKSFLHVTTHLQKSGIEVRVDLPWIGPRKWNRSHYDVAKGQLHLSSWPSPIRELLEKVGFIRVWCCRHYFDS